MARTGFWSLQATAKRWPRPWRRLRVTGRDASEWGRQHSSSVQRYFPDRVVPEVEAVYEYAISRRHARKS